MNTRIASRVMSTALRLKAMASFAVSQIASVNEGGVPAMRILICSNAYPPFFLGGAELMAHEQARALIRRGHKVRVFAGELGSSRPRHTRADDTFEDLLVHRISTTPEDYSPEYLNFLHPTVDRHFRNVLQDFRPDILHCHNLMGLSVKLPVIAKQHGIMTICTLHDFWGFCLRNTAVRPDGRSCDDASQCRGCLPRIHDGHGLHIPLRFRKDFLRLALEHVDRFIAPSQYLADRYIWSGLPADRITVIPNGMDVDRFQPTSGSSTAENIRITYVGYFGTHKGVATLLDAVCMLPQGGPRIALQLAGEGPEHGAYLAQIKALKLHDQVHFLGKIPPSEMPRVYASSDIVVLPSVWDENQPVCLVEAMAAGLPVVASRRGGIPELIDHGETGLMFTAGNAHDLAAQLTRLVMDSQLRQAVGRRGRQRVEKMSHDRQARKQIALYKEVGALPRYPTPSPALFAATGGLRRKMSGEGKALADGRYPARFFMPYEWVADFIPSFRGIILTGRMWSVFRHLGINAVLPVPAPLLKFYSAARSWIGCKRTGTQ